METKKRMRYKVLVDFTRSLWKYKQKIKDKI